MPPVCSLLLEGILLIGISIRLTLPGTTSSQRGVHHILRNLLWFRKIRTQKIQLDFVLVDLPRVIVFYPQIKCQRIAGGQIHRRQTSLGALHRRAVKHIARFPYGWD